MSYKTRRKLIIIGWPAPVLERSGTGRGRATDADDDANVPARFDLRPVARCVASASADLSARLWWNNTWSIFTSPVFWTWLFFFFFSPRPAPLFASFVSTKSKPVEPNKTPIGIQMNANPSMIDLFITVVLIIPYRMTNQVAFYVVLMHDFMTSRWTITALLFHSSSISLFDFILILNTCILNLSSSFSLG